MAYLVNDQTGETVELPEGESTIGRGPLLKIADKRVSRNHALLQHEKGNLKLCPKHKNPCFYKAAKETDFVVLPKDAWQNLYNGDVFKLLPDSLIFRVVSEKKCKDTTNNTSAKNQTQDPKVSRTKDEADDLLDELFDDPNKLTKTATVPVPSDSDEATSKTGGEKVSKSSNSIKGTSTSSDTMLPSAVRKSSPVSAPASVEDEDEVKSKIKRDDSLSRIKAGSTNKPRKLPSWLMEAAGSGSVASLSSKSSAASKKRKAPSKDSSATAAKKSVDDVERDSDTPPSPSPPKKKVAKTDSAAATATRTEVKTRPATKIETTVPSSTPTTAKLKTANDSKKKEKKKPLCPYGTKCYRKNPAHFKEYSHDFSSADADDGDSDYDDSDKPVCPFGADCYRRNPAHRKEYRHPGPPASRSKVTGKRRSTRKTSATGQRSILLGDSDDDGEPNTYDYNDSFIDDDDKESGSSSYGGDSEDSDWAPPPVVSTAADGGDGADDEDLDELLSEAKSFISNKKMRKH